MLFITRSVLIGLLAAGCELCHTMTCNTTYSLVFAAVISVPLGITYDKTDSDMGATEKTNQGNIENAKVTGELQSVIHDTNPNAHIHLSQRSN